MRRRPSRLLLAALVAGVSLLALAPSALAAKKYVAVGQFPTEEEGWVPREFNGLYPDSVAVNDKNHHVYVADSGRGAIFDFNSPTDKEPAKWEGANTPGGPFGGGHLSVAADNTTGDIYVADRSKAVIDKFDQDGNLIASFGDSEPAKNGQLAGLKTPAAGFSPSSGSYSAFGIAVDQASHDLYVLDAGHAVIDIFSESGAYLKQITATPPGLYDQGGENANGIAVSSAGNVYVTNLWSGPNTVYQFDSSGSYVSKWNGGNLPNGAASETPDGDIGPECNGCYLISAGVDDATGEVLVAVQAHRVVDAFDANGNFLAPQATQAGLGSEFLYYSTGVAVDQETGEIYVSQSNRVEIIKPTIVPDVSIDPASNLKATTASLSGHVGLAGAGQVTSCRFEYISNYAFIQNTQQNGAADPWTGAAQTPCSPAAPFSSETDVTGTATGLTAGTGYHQRLVASNANGKAEAVGSGFATFGAYGFSDDIGSSGSGVGQFKEPMDVAVAQSSGDIYVADTGNHRVVRLGPGGQFISAWGWGVSDGKSEPEVCTTSCQAGLAGTGAGQFDDPKFIEVDNSGGASGGDVYVADAAGAVVQKFDPTGSLVTDWGSGGSIDFSKGGAVAGLTVDEEGDMFAATTASPFYWFEVGPDGVFQDKINTSNFYAFGQPHQGIDVDSIGGYYETQSENAGVSYRLPEGAPYSGFSFYGFYGPTLVNSGLVINRRTNDLYVDQGTYLEQFRAGSCNGHEIKCVTSDYFGLEHLSGAAGLAVNGASGALYAANSGSDDIAVFTPNPAPTVSTGGTSEQASTEATLNGHVDPGGEEATNCAFEYGTTTTYSLGEIPCSPATHFPGPTDVSAHATGLVPFLTYHYRVRATGADGLTSFGLDQSFTTLQGTVPSIDQAAATSEAPTTATLSATVNPNLAPTTYSFQYGLDTSYGLQTAPSESIGEDASGHPVSGKLNELRPGTTYHYRVVAANLNGVTIGPDLTFNTPNAPIVSSTEAATVSQSGATLSGELQAGFRSTTYSFEYGRTSSYGRQVGGDAGSDNVLHTVSSPVSGLEPGETYHFRLVATNAFGDTAGPDQTFTTLAAPETKKEEPTPKPACKKGRVKRHGKCVKKPHGTKKKGHGHAHA